MLAHGKLQVDPADNTLMSREAESVEPWLHPVSIIPPLDLYFNDGYHSDLAVSKNRHIKVIFVVCDKYIHAYVHVSYIHVHIHVHTYIDHALYYTHLYKLMKPLYRSQA